MPVKLSNLSKLAYANGFTLWHYKADAMVEVMQRDFFVNAREILMDGDHIHITARDGGCILLVSQPGTRVDVMAHVQVRNPADGGRVEDLMQLMARVGRV